MEKNTKTTTMPPQNPTDSNRKIHFPELEKPFSDLPEINDSSEAETQKPHETVGHSILPSNKTSSEEDTCAAAEDGGRERLKRHRAEVAGRVWIPDMWGQEGLLKDWIDCAALDASLVNSSIVSARDSLVEEGRRTTSSKFREQNGC